MMRESNQICEYLYNLDNFLTRSKNLKIRDLSYRMREGSSKVKTNKMKRYLKEKAEQVRRKSRKISPKKEIKHDVYPSNLEFDDDKLADHIQEDCASCLGWGDTFEDLYHWYDDNDKICDCCDEVLLGKVKFYIECEQFLCQECLLDEN